MKEPDVLFKKGKRLLIFLFLVLLFVTTFSILNFISTKEEIVASVEKDTNDLLYSFAAEKQRFISARITELELISSHLSLLVDKPAEFIDFVDSQSEILVDYVSLGFVTPEGNIMVGKDLVRPIRKWRSFEKSLAGETFIGETFSFYQDSTQKVEAITYPVFF